MSEEHRPLHIFFFPFLAHGHMIPTIDMAKLFASRGVESTIITTPLNVSSISKSPKSTPVHILTIDFPHAQFGTLQGCENLDSLPSPDLVPDFFKASTMLQHPLEQVFQQSHPLPDCIVADMFFPWATDSAAKFGVPRIVFHGNCFFSLCATVCVSNYKPYRNVSTDSEPFVIPNLPGDITVTSSQLPDFVKNSGNLVNRLLSACEESEIRSYGVIVNSFYELEKEYADHYRNVLGRKAWHIGPVSLCNTETEEKANRGKETSINEHKCLKWLDTKKPKSVVYVCFGSMTNFPDSQLREIGMGLEACGQEFIWVLRKSKEDDQRNGCLEDLRKERK